MSTKRDKKMGAPKPVPELSETFDHWEVKFEVTRLKIYDREETLEAAFMSAQEVEDHAREEVLFSDEMPLDRDEIGEIHVRWVDKDGVKHEEKCSGQHCRHYDCRLDDEHYHAYCSQCDIDAY